MSLVFLEQGLPPTIVSVSEPKLKLNPKLLRAAYANGYFPMPHPKTQEVLWYRPDPRAILPLDGFHVSKSLQRRLCKNSFRATFDTDFSEVMQHCADREETWINEEFHLAYNALHKEGNAHSVEVWFDDKLAGGVYGVSLGGAFFAESMFHLVTDASKAALYFLTQKLKAMGYELLEVQFLTDHLESLGAAEIPSAEYLQRLKLALKKKTIGTWT